MAGRRLAPGELVARREGDVWYLESALKLAAPPARPGDLLRRAASRAPDRDFLIERCEEGLRRVRYREAFRAAEGVGDWLVRDRRREGPVVALSGNSVDHALALLAWPSVGACRGARRARRSDRGARERRRLRARVRKALTAWNSKNCGSSTRIQRLLLLCDPPSIDAGEITDKGYTNQRAVLMRRAADVERLYNQAGDETIQISDR